MAPSSVTAYRNHDFDPILISGGDSLVFRAFEVTGGCGDINHCPDKFCLSPSQEDAHFSPSKLFKVVNYLHCSEKINTEFQFFDFKQIDK